MSDFVKSIAICSSGNVVTISRGVYDNPRHRAGRSDGTCRIGHRPASVPLGATVRRLVGTDTTSEVEWRQRAAWAYHQDGRQVPAQAPHCRHDLTCVPCKAQSRDDRATVGESARAKARAGCNCRHGKQDSTDYLGNHDTWRDLSGRPPAGTGDKNNVTR
jgi:hypothetical protein